MTRELILYELAGADPDLRFSPQCWKVRLALAHKDLEVKRIPWRLADKSPLAAAEQKAAPVLVHGPQVISGSWHIALYLEEHFSDRPSLFSADRPISMIRFVDAWADLVLGPCIGRLILRDVYACLDEPDRKFFRAERESWCGITLDDVLSESSVGSRELTVALKPLRRALETEAFLSGSIPGYADYCVFGMFMWARCSSEFGILYGEETINRWRDLMLDSFGGLARSARAHRKIEDNDMLE